MTFKIGEEQVTLHRHSNTRVLIINSPSVHGVKVGNSCFGVNQRKPKEKRCLVFESVSVYGVCIHL